MRRVDRGALWSALIAFVAKGVDGRVAEARRGRSVVCVGGIGARWVRKSSGVRGSPPKTGGSGGGVSPPKIASWAWQGEGVSPPKPTPGTGQVGVVNPHARMR